MPRQHRGTVALVRQTFPLPTRARGRIGLASSGVSGPILCWEAKTSNSFLEFSIRLDETLVYVAPSPRPSRRKAGGDRVVSLLVVRLGVLVRRVIGTGDPAAGQADHKACLAVSAAPAVLTVAGLRPDRRNAVEVLTSGCCPVQAYGRRA